MTIEEYRNCESLELEANKRRMEDDGVNFVDLYSAYIDEEVVIERCYNCSECHNLRQIYN